VGAARVFACLVLLLAALGAPWCPALAAEAVTSFASWVAVLPDGRLQVTETIAVAAEGREIRRGIYRDFPTVYPHPEPWAQALGLVRRVGFSVRGAMRDGAPEAFAIRPRPGGVRVYLGREDALLPPGPHTFTLAYETTDQLGFFADHDELYWNVTGQGWTLPILRAACEVALPPGARLLGAEAFTGFSGERGAAFSGGAQGPELAAFATTAPLAPGQGLTVAVRLGKGAVAAPGGEAARLARDNPGPLGAVAGLLAALGAYLWAWRRVGRDPEGGVVVPRFRPPAGVSPGAARYVLRMGFDDHVFAAALVGLAVRGAVSLDRAPGGAWTVARAAAAAEGLEPEERALLDALFARGPEVALRQEAHAVVRPARAALRKALAARYRGVIFHGNAAWLAPGLALGLAATGGALWGAPEPVPAAFLALWLTVWTAITAGLVLRALAAPAVGTVVPALAFAAGWCGGALMLGATAGGLPLAVVALAGAMAVLFAWLMRAPMPRGRAVMDELEGFRLYLAVAEEERLNLLNPPDRTPELFDACLPYALALDCEQQWARKFSAELEAAGRDPRAASRGAGLAARGGLGPSGRGGGLGSSLAGAIAASSSAPGSGRGSGGSGRAGGGGGGGGGGGW